MRANAFKMKVNPSHMGFDIGDFLEDTYKKALPKLEESAVNVLQKEGQKLIDQNAPQVTQFLQSNIINNLPQASQVSEESKKNFDALVASYLGVTPQQAKIGFIVVGGLFASMFTLLVYRELKRA